MKKIAITGLSGVVGHRLISSLPRRVKIFDLYHTSPGSRVSPRRFESHRFDLISQKLCLTTLRDLSPEIIVHMAAITHIDQCEQYRKEGKKGLAWKINVSSLDPIIMYCKESGARLIFLSTECVFDGKRGMYTEKSTPNPINWYGETKAAAEKKILDSKIGASILRSVVAFDPQSQSETIYGHFATILKSNKELRVVDDLYFMPTYVGDIRKMIAQLVCTPKPGVFHITSPDKLTPYEFALIIAKRIGADQKLVVPVKAKDFFGVRRASRRLRKATLDSKRTQEVIGIAGQSVESVLL
jgi:dTDP-4-dehydrorhamnose reductase